MNAYNFFWIQKKLSYKMTEREAFGLPNIGNTCFANVAFQSILTCTSLRDEIILKNCFCSECFDPVSGFGVDSHNSCVQILVEYKDTINRCYEVGRSHDCHEFLTMFFDKIETEKQKIEYKEVIKLEDGTVTSEYERFENIMSIQVMESIIDGIVDFMIEEADDHTINRTFLKVNDVFIVHLKRFQMSFENGVGTASKIETNVKVDEELTIKIKDAVTVFELKSVIVHLGQYGGGHYVCFQKIKGEWYLISDTEVFKCKDNPDFRQAYILFYQRK